jgi:hypothetical protein
MESDVENSQLHRRIREGSLNGDHLIIKPLLPEIEARERKYFED